MSSFDDMYKGDPPWDTGRAQFEIVALEEKGGIRGRVLDAGCGTGENALYLATKGYEVWGVDLSPTAISKANEKARERDIDVRFSVHDVLDLPSLGMVFDTVIDSGVFHTFPDDAREAFVASVASVLSPGGVYHMIAFSELEPGSWGPRRVTAAEIRSTFSQGWRVDGISDACYETNFDNICAMAWLATVVREDGEG
jgi:cyclopropane fatty-acyl-phospholipid synthase-like methyltransferase